MGKDQKVLFINPSRNLRKQNTNEPLWAESLAAVLERQNVYVQILDGTIKPITESKIEGFNFVGVTTTTPQYPIALSILKKIQKINSRSKNKIHTIIGGPHVTLVESISRDGWDTICVGEGEEIIGSIIKNKLQGRIIAKTIENLDKLPYPARHLVDLNQYKRDGAEDTSISIFGMRGCPYNCVYCASPLLGGKVRFRSPSNIIGEIDDVVAKYNIRNVCFYDQIFTLDRQRVIKLCQGLKKRKIKWKCQTRVDRVDSQLLRMMHKSGCQEVSFGIESAHPDVVNFMNKGMGYSTEKAKEAILMAKDAGLSIRAFFMFGFPVDSWKSVKSNLSFINETNPDIVRLSLLTPFPGTSIYSNAKKYGIELPSDMTRYQYYGPRGVSDSNLNPVIRKTKYLNEEEFQAALLVFQKGIAEWASRLDKSK